MHYSLADFDFELPHELVAQKPASPRDHARLLIYDRATKQITDDYFYNLKKYLPIDTTLVINNSKVDKCRLKFADCEIFVLENANDTTVRAMVRPGKRFRTGNTVAVAEGLTATVTAIDGSGIRTIRFNKPLDSTIFDDFKLTPLPPYIAQDESLSNEYQTVYADPLGSKAAPTAGLHFTDALLESIALSHDVARITLHVGLGTFAPVKTDDLSQHTMHSEWFEISDQAAKTLNNAQHITAVGTTSVRTLESAHHPFTAQAADTAIFITPGYQFKKTDALITNFHLPKSTLLMLVAAFLGSVDELHMLYKHAIDQKYRFYSFGDAMLIL